MKFDPEGLVLCCRTLWRERGAYHATFVATDEATGTVSWGNVQLASTLSRATFLKGLVVEGMPALGPGRFAHACLALDTAERRGPDPSVIAPRKPAPDSWLVPGWIPLNAPTVLYGAGGTGKSLLALYFAVCALSGRMCGPWSVARIRRTLYLDWEEKDKTPHEERLYGLLGVNGLPEPGDRLQHMAMTVPLYEGIESLRTRVDRDGIDLVIVDSLAIASTGLGEVEGSEAALRSMSALRTLTRTTALVLGHVNALGVAQTEGIPKLYGSIFNTNLARSLIYLGQEDLSDQEKKLTAHLTKRNRAGARPPVGFRLVFSDDPNSTDCLIRADAPDLSRGPLGARIISFLKESRVGAETAADIAEMLGVRPNHVRSELGRLEKSSKVTQLSAAAGGRGKKSLWGLRDTKRSNMEP